MKKIIGIIGVVAFALTIFFSSGLDTTSSDINLEDLVTVKTTNAEIIIPGHFSDGYCVCKNGVCQDGNWIGFRKTCGTGDSDFACHSHSGC